MPRTGRPPVDPAGPGRLGPTDLGDTRRKRVEAYAARAGVSLAEAVRQLLDEGLDRVERRTRR